MNKKLIDRVEADAEALEKRDPRVCQDFNAALLLRGAANLLREADERRGGTVPPPGQSASADQASRLPTNKSK